MTPLTFGNFPSAKALISASALSLAVLATGVQAQALPASCSVLIKATSVCMRGAADGVAALKPTESKTLLRPNYTSMMGSMLSERPDSASYCRSKDSADVIIASMKGLATKYGIADPQALVTDDCRAAMKPLIQQVVAAHPELAQ